MKIISTNDHIVNILNKINPVRLLTVSEWMEIAKILIQEKTGGYLAHTSYIENLSGVTINLQSRFEELTRGKLGRQPIFKPSLVDDVGLAYDATESVKVFQPALLKKEMFVCEVEEPALYKNWLSDGKPELPGVNMDNWNAYQAAQSKIWFEGFENEAERVVTHSNAIVTFEKTFVTVRFAYDNFLTIPSCTVFDFLYLIDRYNRTASEKIKINFTENFVKELLK